MGRIKEKRAISEYRRKFIKQPKNTILIAVEGSNKTEKLYFNNFNHRDNNYILKIAKGNTTDPLNMVKSLICEIEKLGIDINLGDKVYCVFDTDTNKRKNSQILEAKVLAASKGIEIITSSPCFEEWILCHFEKSTAFLNNKDAFNNVCSYIQNYSKNMDIYPLIKNLTGKAIKNAKYKEKFQIDRGNKIDSVDANPSTTIYKIVEYLNSYKDQ